MKPLFGLALVAVSLLGAFAFSELQQNKLLGQQIANYERQNAQLLTQIENNSLKNIETAKALRSLQNELSGRDGQLAALSRQLETAQMQIDPNYQEIEAQIRRQLTSEIQANNTSANTDPRISLIKQLSSFDPMEANEIISLNAQYGEFLKSLNIGDERMDVVINALSNMIADQNQARSAIAEEMRADPSAVNSSDFRERMQAISLPEAQIEALSYELTESELNAFSEFQEKQRTSYNPFFISSPGATFSTSTGTASGINYFSTDVIIENNSGQPRPARILRAQPSN